MDVCVPAGDVFPKRTVSARERIEILKHPAIARTLPLQDKSDEAGSIQVEMLNFYSFLKLFFAIISAILISLGIIKSEELIQGFNMNLITGSIICPSCNQLP